MSPPEASFSADVRGSDDRT